MDTAIKIGLGVLIYGLFDLAKTRMRGERDRARQLRERRLETIQKCAMDFEDTCEVFIDLFAEYAVVLRAPEIAAQTRTELRAVVPGVVRGRITNVMDLVTRRVGPALKSLHRIEVLLITVGAKNAADATLRYRLAATELQSEVHDPEVSTEAPPTAERWDELGGRTATVRQEFYEQIRLGYVNS